MKCIEDEIPFDVPEGWEWSRLGSISADVLYGLSNSAQMSGTHKLLRITDIQDGKVKWDNVPFTSITDKENYLLKNKDIVFARTGATVGKSFLIVDVPENAVYASYLIRIRVSEVLNADYIYQFFNSEFYWMQITDKSVGVGQPNCNGTSLRELLLPVPPLIQQNNICNKVTDLAQFVNNIEDMQRSMTDTVGLTKSKILNLAIRGKLVPQNADDEPASVLLERIRSEKEELIKQGKIKRDKNESIIYKGDDNSYYEKIGN
ncbi:MAG: restriction endonuclease subunit S, partial [Lachnospiraceae bacterium]